MKDAHRVYAGQAEGTVLDLLRFLLHTRELGNFSSSDVQASVCEYHDDHRYSYDYSVSESGCLLKKVHDVYSYDTIYSGFGELFSALVSVAISEVGEDAVRNFLTENHRALAYASVLVSRDLLESASML